MEAVPVLKLVSPARPGGTTLWASEKVLSLVCGEAAGLDRVQRGLLRKRLQRYCDDGMRVFMPETVKREYNKTFGIHVGHFRIVGFFDHGYGDFIALDWFMKKTRQNDRRMNAAYEKADRIRESGQWQRAE